MRPLVLVLGPTGSGKSDLALDVAERFKGEIVNCDSLQFYRGFDIGTAKTPASERRGIPHHLFDTLEPEETFTAGDYARVARPVLREISGRAKLPIVAGGTGFYARALLEGLFAGPSRDDELRARLSAIEERRPGFLHRALGRYDRAAAHRIHPNDKKKVTRALEVCLAARRPISELFEEGRDRLTDYRWLKLVLNPSRADLYYKLDQRCSRMLEAGLIDEVIGLLRRGVSPQAKPFEAIGYKETLRFVQGDLTLDEALEQMRRDTRRYAKRQLTWFRRDSDARWLSGFGTESQIRDSAMNMLAKFLQTSIDA